jgi:electron transport complex protein RnfD
MSAVLTGVLLAFVCPSTIPLWTVIIGDFFAIIVVKMIFGGIGRNIVNPALAGRAFMFSYPALMTHWVTPGLQNMLDLSGVDAETTATPLYHMGQNLLPQESVLDLFLGNVGGCLGETSALLLLIGLAYLLIRKVITLRIPVAFVGTVALLTFLFPMGGQDRVAWMSAQVLSGGLMLGAIFMATDYVTSPITKLGQVVYGIGCGVLTVVIRYFGGYPEGVSYAILIMNCCVVLLDRIGRPKKFGSVKKEVAAK